MSKFAVGDVITHPAWEDAEREVVIAVGPDYYVTVDQSEWPIEFGVGQFSETVTVIRSDSAPRITKYVEPLSVGDAVEFQLDTYEILAISLDGWLMVRLHEGLYTIPGVRPIAVHRDTVKKVEL